MIARTGFAALLVLSFSGLDLLGHPACLRSRFPRSTRDAPRSPDLVTEAHFPTQFWTLLQVSISAAAATAPGSHAPDGTPRRRGYCSTTSPTPSAPSPEPVPRSSTTSTGSSGTGHAPPPSPPVPAAATPPAARRRSTRRTAGPGCPA